MLLVDHLNADTVPAMPLNGGFHTRFRLIGLCVTKKPTAFHNPIVAHGYYPTSTEGMAEGLDIIQGMPDSQLSCSGVLMEDANHV